MTKLRVSRMIRRQEEARRDTFQSEREGLFAENQKLWERVRVAENLNLGDECYDCWTLLTKLADMMKEQLERIDRRAKRNSMAPTVPEKKRKKK
jgi:hypothetical protein